MELNRAAEHLQVIRTLMERSAIYRRALAPVMLLAGLVGIAAGILGWWFGIETGKFFGAYWLTISVAVISGAYVMVRRQAIRSREVFWSPPTRRVTQALLPALFVGMIASGLVVRSAPGRFHADWLLALLWMALYGCAIHAAGFFTPRGMKLFGWIFILAASFSTVALEACRKLPEPRFAHLLMAATFGGLHVAYGIYLYFTEPRKNEV